MSHCLMNKILGKYNLEGSDKNTVKEMAQELLNDQDFHRSASKVRRISYACKAAYHSYVEIQNGVERLSKERTQFYFAYR